MKDFLTYFFSKGDTAEFHNFTLAHFTPIVVVALLIYFTNRALGPGANYLYMAEPEETPSILDILPPNFALRACVMAAVIITMFVLSYLPWYFKDRKAKKAAAAEVIET